jgi:cytochrome c oxidase subunit 1
MTETILTALPEDKAKSLNKLTLVWILTMLVLFAVLASLGLLLRSGQGNIVGAGTFGPQRFYSVMTLHGVGMVGLWYTAGMAGVSYFLARYVNLSVGVNKLAFLGTLVGVVMLIVSTLIGKFGAGWYFLYPLPMKSIGAWQEWATTTFFLSLAILGVAWTVWSIDILRAIAKRYSFSSALCWHYLRGKSDPEVPPIVLISTVSLIAGLTGLVSAVVLLVLFAVELIFGGVTNDALLMKNLTFLFGHLLVNITLYLGVGMVYELLPEYSGRPWKTNRYVALAWNAVLILVIFAYFHHLYMDFVQIRWFQIAGQITSYLSSLPAAVMSIYGTLVIVYRAKIQWTLVPLLLFLGVLGWTLGGIGAVIDSTVSVNLLFHNTLWVPAHFHTYFLMGVVLMIMGAAFHICHQLVDCPERRGMTKAIAITLCVGGYGFLLSFYASGAASIPRRYASYTPDLGEGVTYAKIAAAFIAIFLVGLVLYIWETARRCIRAFKEGV